MIYYNLSKKTAIIDKHFKSLETLLTERLDKSHLDEKQKKFIRDNLKQIIIGKPDELLRLYDNFNKIEQNIAKKKIVEFFRKTKNELKKIFNYDSFVKKKSEYNAYILAEKLKIRVCLYCNRDYTLTIRKNGIGITRPEFDHFFDKGNNPLLALSIYNLIPSCHICNSTLKGTVKFDLQKHFHPYIDDLLTEYRYSYKPRDVDAILGNTANLEIELITKNPKIRETAKVFQLANIFNGYTEEIRDLFDIRYRFSESYLTQLFNTYNNLGISYDEAYRIAFGVHYNESDFGRRPFSKLKKDILTELQIIT